MEYHIAHQEMVYYVWHHKQLYGWIASVWAFMFMCVEAGVWQCIYAETRG